MTSSSGFPAKHRRHMQRPQRGPSRRVSAVAGGARCELSVRCHGFASLEPLGSRTARGEQHRLKFGIQFLPDLCDPLIAKLPK